MSNARPALPITGLAEASARPENFVGLHFFSPVDKIVTEELANGMIDFDAQIHSGIISRPTVAKSRN